MTTQEAQRSNHVCARNRASDLSLFASWVVVSALALAPLIEPTVGFTSLIYVNGVIALVTSLISCAFLRRRQPWLRLVLHIYSQVMIWLSLTVLLIAAVICWGV